MAEKKEIIQILPPSGKLKKGVKIAVSDADLVKLYRLMVKMRAVDGRAMNLQRQGRLGFYIGGTGEEATQLGTAYPLKPTDWVFPCYREPGPALWRGFTLESLFHSLFGTVLDKAKGRQMPGHYHDQEHYYASISSPVGTQIPQATGAAMAEKIKGSKGVVVVYFGDGATSQGDFHVACNFAGVFKAPVIFVCRNNGYAISVPFEKQTAAPNIACKAIGYGIEGVRVDGNDLLAVIDVTREAVERARSGKGATLIESVTYRAGSHSSSDDPSLYRKKGEAEAWAEKDPLIRMKRFLVGKNLWSEEEEEKHQQVVQDEITKAIKICEKTPKPPLESLFEDVFDVIPWHLREQRDDLLAYLKEGK